MTSSNSTRGAALVTGASSGMGKNFAAALLKENFQVYTAARRVDRMADLEDKGATALKLDITDDEQIRDAVKRIESECGGIDVLVNNAGFGMFGAVEDTTIDDARYQFEVNLFGLARLTQLLLPSMRKKRAGKIVNISSMGGKVYTPLGSWYHASKHALEGWSDCLRIELAQFGIHVVLIEPGAIRTEFGKVMVAPMMARSGSGPYQRMAKAVADAFAKGSASDPGVVTDTVIRAVKANRPKTRYVTGQYAIPLILFRKFLGDRLYDRMILTMVK